MGKKSSNLGFRKGLKTHSVAVQLISYFFPSVVVVEGAESFSLYSCVINGEEKEQSHRAVYR